MSAVIKRRLGARPQVKRFIHDVHPRAVTGPQQRRGGGVVGYAHRIEASLLQAAYPPLLRLFVTGSAQQTVIVVYAAAQQLNRLAIDAQPMARIDGKRADAKGRLRRVAFSLRVRKAALAGIKRRDLSGPWRRMTHGESLGNAYTPVRCQTQWNLRAGNLSSLRVDQRGFQRAIIRQM